MKLTARSDDLVARLKSRAPDAFATLLEEFGPRLRATARRVCGNPADADDVMQEAMVSCFRNVDSFKGESSIYTWLHRIVVTCALMRLRKKKRRQEASIEPLLPQYYDDGHRVTGASPAWAASADELAQRKETRSVVRRCIDALPDTYRDVLVLRDIEELDTAAAAGLLGVNEGVVKTRLHRARQALRTLLEPFVTSGQLQGTV